MHKIFAKYKNEVILEQSYSQTLIILVFVSKEHRKKTVLFHWKSSIKITNLKGKYVFITMKEICSAVSPLIGKDLERQSVY